MKKQQLFIVFGVMLLGLVFGISQYFQALKTEDVSAVTVGIPNPGHAWSSMECSGDSLCIDPTGGKLGIGTNTPSQKLEVNGNIKLSGASPSYTVSNVIAPVASSDVATKAYVDAASGGPSCPTNYGNLCSNGGGLAFTYSSKTMYIDAYPRAAAWYASGSPTGQGLAWQMCGAIGARLPTLEEWQAACTALSGPNGNGTATFGGGKSDRWEWTATPSSATGSYAVLAGGGTCSGTGAYNVSNNGGYYDWFRCVR
ncbi:MAG: hypothetical protein WC319_13685 [Candidatus Paceibacterota bacterium]|jgi:hypothetical protein